MKNKMMIITALSLVAALCFSGCSVSESVVEDITSAAEKIAQSEISGEDSESEENSDGKDNHDDEETDVASGDVYSITEGGSYDISGEYSQIHIDTDDDVTLNLGDLTIMADQAEAIYSESKDNTVTVNVTGKVTLQDGTDFSHNEESTTDNGFFGNGGNGRGDMTGFDHRGDAVSGNMPQMPDGEMPDFSDGNRPQMPDGEMPDFSNGNRPEMPDGERPDFSDENRPQTPDGEMPDFSNGENPVEQLNTEIVQTDNGNTTGRSDKTDKTDKTENAFTGDTSDRTEKTDSTKETVDQDNTGNSEESDNTEDVEADNPKAVIFVKGNLIISGDGEINITANSKHGIKSKGTLEIKDTVSINITAYTDGIHSESDITLNGGNITISEATEGIESETALIINDGILDINTSDDGINAAGDITINGGTFNVVSSGNDAIDTNSAMYLNGGQVYACGLSNPEGAFDIDNNKFEVNGGIMIGLGSVNAQPTGGSQNTLIIAPTTDDTLKNLEIKDEDGNTVFTYEFADYTIASRTEKTGEAGDGVSENIDEAGNTNRAFRGGMNGGTPNIFISSDALVSGETYEVFVNGASQGTVTINSVTTTLGNVATMGGFGGGQKEQWFTK